MCKAQSVLVIALVVRLTYSWDIAVTAGDRIEFYTDVGTKTDTVRFNSQNLTALAYDEVHNMLLYVDKQSDNDAICGYNISYVEYKCYIEKNGRNIQGLAFDPVTEVLFFTDTKERSINWFSFKPGSKNNVYGNTLIKMDEGIPTDIAVDSCRGVVYWINTNLTTSTIERARLDGSEREVVINAKYNLDLHSLAIDQKTRKIYWFMAENSLSRHIYSADLNGKNEKYLKTFHYQPGDTLLFSNPNTLSVSKEILFSMAAWCSPCTKSVWTMSKPNYEQNKLFTVDTESVVGIATNYKVKDQLQGMSGCGHVPYYETNDLFRIAREYEGSFCVHGVKDIGQSLCKCTIGYTGLRCEVSVCENYCLQGNCSFTEEGLPKCRCNAGYSGERCEMNVCNGYCFNNGTCSLNEEDEPVCECIGGYEGQRCDVQFCPNNGDEVVEPACQCDGSHDSSRDIPDKNKTISTTTTHYSSEGNLKISVVVEIKSNN